MDRTDKIVILSGFATALMVAALCAIPGCGVFKQTGRTLNDAASILCGLFAAEAAETDPAMLDGLSTADYCAIHDNLKPFIDEALSAKAAASRVSLARPRPSSADAGL